MQNKRKSLNNLQTKARPIHTTQLFWGFRTILITFLGYKKINKHSGKQGKNLKNNEKT